MKSMTTLFRVGSVIVLICIGVWLYVEWDLKRFRESLPSSSQRTDERSLEHFAPAVSEGERNGTGAASSAELDTAPIDRDTGVLESESRVASTETDVLFDTDPQFREALLPDADLPEVSNGDGPREAPYDLMFVKAGYADYNAYLNTDPEYAYRRLDDAFREQFGDSPDVDILLESVRRYNEGPVPIDTAIRFAEAQLRLLSKFGYPEPIAVLQDHIEMLRETRQYGLESGEEVLYQNNYRFVSE